MIKRTDTRHFMLQANTMEWRNGFSWNGKAFKTCWKITALFSQVSIVRFAFC